MLCFWSVTQFIIQILMSKENTQGFQHILMLSIVVTVAHFMLLVMREVLNLAIAGVDRLDKNKELRRYSARGDVANVEYTLRNGADIQSTDHEGRTALMIASTKGHVKVLKVFLGYMDELEEKEGYGRFSREQKQ
eukprot:TRINITY_DN1158_c0_g1_i2.p1 TRINITY_DN1158_c0_g1~~TRINITY_DN1158_c0_g1_i2.p1  ORF type:complete len:135 (-),score=15.53 TRINITY_DN1158_c0_g1_i2:83-487(-)